MKRAIGGALACLLAMNSTMSAAQADDCASSSELAALRTAALQQELMVAAFSCHDVERYNHFVLAHRPELIDSDARLKAFFVRRDARHGEAGYHSYKTELANASSVDSLRDIGEFCASADSAFARAEAGLSYVLHTVRASYPACQGALPATQTASGQPPPRSAANTGSGSVGMERSAPAPHQRLEADYAL